MDTARGVITLCYGPPRYRDQALALARSIRLRSSGVSLAVVTDRPAGEFAGLFLETRQAFLDHERAKSELKTIMPEDAKEAIGHGIRGKRSKAGAVSFETLETEVARA